jgi:hypothetical protein
VTAEKKFFFAVQPAVARRLGASKQHEIDLFGDVADVWVTSRDTRRDLQGESCC